MRGCEVSTPAFPPRPPAARAGPGPARPPPPPPAPSFRPLSAGRGRGGSPRSQGWLSAGPGPFSPLGPKAPAPRPDSAGVEISPSGIVGLLYQPSDKDRCEPTPLISRSFVFFASPRPPREVWQVRGQQSGWKSSPPPASFLRKNGRLGSAAKHPASPGALCHRRFCQSSIGAMKTPCPAAVFPLDTFRDPPLCRAPGKLRGWFSRSGEGGGCLHSPGPVERRKDGGPGPRPHYVGEKQMSSAGRLFTRRSPPCGTAAIQVGEQSCVARWAQGRHLGFWSEHLEMRPPPSPAPPESTARRGPRSVCKI